MYFADSLELQGHLNDDWSVLLHNIKARGELLHQLLQYNHQVIRQRLQEDEVFTNDQILHHHSRIASVTQANAVIDQEEGPILAKYETAVVSWEGVSKLMQRVAARVLEAFQLSLEQCKTLDEELVEKHAKMRQSLVRLLNQRDRIDLQAIGSLVVGFARGSLISQIDRLKDIVEALERGEVSRLHTAYDFRAKRASLQQLERQKAIEMTKHSSMSCEEHSLAREEILRQQKARKHKQKVAMKLAQGLSSIMDLSRQQFVEDVCGYEGEKATRLYNEIFSRNRFNHQQILAFEAKKDQFLEKLGLFKEMMERQSAKITQGMAQKLPKFKIRDGTPLPTEIVLAESPSEQALEEFTQEESVTQRKLPPARYRIQSPKQRQKVTEFLNSFNSPAQAAPRNFNHLKFDVSNQEIFLRTNRKRMPLPIITHPSQLQPVSRTTSLGQRMEINCSSTRRGREEVNNEEISGRKSPKRAEITAKKSQLENRNRLLGKNSQLSQGESKKIENFEPPPMEYTFYMRRSKQKFYQARLNAVL